MEEKLTKAQLGLRDAMLEHGGGRTVSDETLEVWAWVPAYESRFPTLLYKERFWTPENISRRHWPDERYSRMIHLSIVAGKPMLRWREAPWLGARDNGVITYKKAHEILEDPKGAWRKRA